MATTSNLILNYSGVRFESQGMAGHFPQTEEDRNRGYLTATWRDIPVFRCCLCPFDSRSEEEIYAHLFKMHHQAPKPIEVSRPVQALLFDPDGREIETIAVPQEEEVPVSSVESDNGDLRRTALAEELRKIEQGFAKTKRRRS